MFSIALFAEKSDSASFDFVSEGRASFAEHGNLSFDFFEQLHLASMIRIYELGTRDCVVRVNKLIIPDFDFASFLVAGLTHPFISNCKNFRCPRVLLPAEPRCMVAFTVLTLPWR